MTYFGNMHIYRIESLNSRSVDDVSFLFDFEHFGIGGNVSPFVVVIRYRAYLGLNVRIEPVDQRRLAHTGVAGQKADFTSYQRAHFLYAFAFESGYFQARIGDGFVEPNQRFEVFGIFSPVEVYFVEKQAAGNAIGFGRSQKAVYKNGMSLRVVYGDHQYGQVDISRQNM